MLSTIESVNSAVNNFIWGVPAMICIIGVGLYLSIRTGFLQIRKFPYAMKVTIGRMLRKRDASDGALTPFVPRWRRRSEPEISPESQEQSQSEGRAQCSGCGSQHFLECVQSFQKLLLQFISMRRMQKEIVSVDRCIISKMV